MKEDWSEWRKIMMFELTEWKITWFKQCKKDQLGLAILTAEQIAKCVREIRKCDKEMGLE